MPKTSFSQKFLLFAFSVFILAVVLEVGLRTAGALYTFSQNRTNVISLDKNEIRILCIGESTTAMGAEDSYPSQLESILNSKNLDSKFKIINQGMISKTTSDIFDKLNQNIKTYQPHIVVGMMGVNDFLIEIQEDNETGKTAAYFKKFRVVKLVSLIAEHLAARFGVMNEDKIKHLAQLDESEENNEIKNNPRTIKTFRENIDRMERLNKEIKVKVEIEENQQQKENLKNALLKNYYALGILYRRTGNNELAKTNLLLARDGTKDLETVYLELGLIFKEEENYSKAVEMFEQSLQIATSKRALMEYARTADLMGNIPLAANLYLLVVRTKPESARTYIEIGRWYERHNLIPHAEKIYLAGMENKPDDYFIQDALVNLYNRIGLKKFAANHQKLAETAKEKVIKDISVTEINYKKIVEVVQKRGLMFVAMQYPLRSVAPIKNYFPENNDIIYVENKDNFESALKAADYSEYFTDNFAIDFGHCTRKGNQLIANNLADAILEKLLNGKAI